MCIPKVLKKEISYPQEPIFNHFLEIMSIMDITKKNWKHNKNSFDPTYHYQTRTMKSRFMKTTHKFHKYVKSVVKQKEYGL